MSARVSGVLSAVWGLKRLWVLHLFANVALAAAFYGWLWIPDAALWQLALTAFAGVAIIFAALQLHGESLAVFVFAHHGEDSGAWVSFHGVLGRVLALALWAALFILLLWPVRWCEENAYDASVWIASWLTNALRRPVSPEKLARVADSFVDLARWFFLPLVLMPLATSVTRDGFAGFGPAGLRCAWRILWRWKYWLGAIALFAIGAYAPYKLIFWTPEMKGFSKEIASLLARFLPAYLLFVTAWLAYLSLLAKLSEEPPTEIVATPEPVPVPPREKVATVKAEPAD